MEYCWARADGFNFDISYPKLAQNLSYLINRITTFEKMYFLAGEIPAKHFLGTPNRTSVTNLRKYDGAYKEST